MNVCKLPKTFKNVLILGTLATLLPLGSVLGYNEASQETASSTEEVAHVIYTKTYIDSLTSSLPKDKKSNSEKVRRGLVLHIDDTNSTFNIRSEDKTLRIVITTPETRYEGGDDDYAFDDLHTLESDRKVYVYGYFVEDGAAMVATKILIGNKSKLTRK